MGQSQTRRSPLSAPVNVTWEITGRCNLRCRHCLSADVRGHCGEELDFEECRRFIDDLDRMDVFQINFGGGEPFLREDFLEILRYAHTRGITTCVSTNATLLDSRLVEQLSRMERLYLQVSLDGATPGTNDAIRGRGTFERVLAAMEMLRSCGFLTASTNTVVTRVNYGEISAIADLGRRYGMKTRLSRFRPSGDAKKVWTDYQLERQQLAHLAVFLNRHREILTGDSFFSITGKGRRQLGLDICGAAKMTCSLSPDGLVYPCAFLQDGSFVAGNIRCLPFESIWRHAPVFTMLRDIRIDSCTTCGRFDLCHGGCPAVAYFLTRSLDQPDPECSMRFDRGRTATTAVES